MDRPRHEDGRVHGVIVACRRDDGRWLHIRRALHVVAAPGKICFPGGAIEVGERHEDAAMREFREEIGAPVRLVRRVWHMVCPDKPLTLWGWLGQLESLAFQPDPAEVHETLWLTADEAMTHPDILPHHDKFLQVLQQVVSTEPLQT